MHAYSKSQSIFSRCDSAGAKFKFVGPRSGPTGVNEERSTRANSLDGRAGSSKNHGFTAPHCTATGCGRRSEVTTCGELRGIQGQSVFQAARSSDAQEWEDS